MESVNVKKLLEAYFEGNTSLEEEKKLQDYFTNQTVADDLVQYQPIFAGLKAAKEERSSKAFTLPESKPKTIKTWWYSAAAILVMAFGAGSFYFSQPHYTQEEKEALAAFEKSKNAMLLLSENLNKGAEQLTFVKQFAITKDKIFE
ncbi:hypothetical protein POV26_05435 [Aequorivita todarodis]|uniref:hypothetical protein n=1 Tax=Aequorivita todarodis TaxID=2036821 RepID=UPI00234FE5DB|nr:hypothetical protein [Aequorivita todarodis]MDC8000468.1 hypothetical protein [Aequorivita todarodis]